MLFVTGMLRCGTTLLEKLLAHHPRISVLSQPFPFIFLEAKRAFLQTLGRPGERYPLGDLFLEAAYTPGDFARFLRGYQPSAGQLLAAFEAMSSYSGQRTRFAPAAVAAALEGLGPGDFEATLSQLYTQLDPRTDVDWHGGKETLCEEFLPYLLERSAVCAVIIRDPRDMLASLNHGRGREYGGTLKPTLFNLRQWRKSVGFALHLQTHPRFTWMRYEDLVADPVASLAGVATILDVAPFTAGMFEGGIRDQDGLPWHGNSSHVATRTLDSSSVGAYVSRLPPEVIAFTEAVCSPELTCLGYPMSLPAAEIPSVIDGFRDPYPDVRPDLRETFADPRRIAEERARLVALEQPDSGGYFLSDDVRGLLRTAVAR